MYDTKPTAVRGFRTVRKNYGVTERAKAVPGPKDPENFMEYVVGNYFPNGAVESEFVLGFQAASLTGSGIDMKLYAWDDALGFLVTCTDLLTALAPLANKTTPMAVRGFLLQLGFQEIESP